MKALGLLSGGLDSTLAVKLVQDQGILVKGVYFRGPFIPLKNGNISSVSKQLGISIRPLNLGKQYFKVLRQPKYGYGKNLNPCIDCRIFMLKKAKAYAKKIQASFLITGEVLNERPMTQNRDALKIAERESDLEGKILRPLSAKLLAKTEAENQGWIDREKLLDIRGRSRKKQIQLAKKLGIKKYPTPAGGCLLTCKEFAAKTRDLLLHKGRITKKDIDLLKVGRHFRFEKSKIVVGRNEDENRTLIRIRGKSDYIFEVPDCGSPITLLQGTKTQESIKVAAALTLRYSDKKEDSQVKFGEEELTQTMFTSTLTPTQVKNLRVQ